VTGSIAQFQFDDARVHVMQTCHKQYKNAMEMETHLSSYDHHHTKVLRVGGSLLLHGTPAATSMLQCEEC
jgi:hypothetical protein